MKRIFVVYGHVDSGKTHTMWMVLNYLLEAGAKITEFHTMSGCQYTHADVMNHPEPIHDFYALLVIYGKKIAIWSEGDKLVYFEDKMTWATTQNADYVVCCARGRNRKGSVYRKLHETYMAVCSPDKDWFGITKDSNESYWLQERDKTAQVVAKKILEEIEDVKE